MSWGSACKAHGCAQGQRARMRSSRDHAFEREFFVSCGVSRAHKRCVDREFREYPAKETTPSVKAMPCARTHARAEAQLECARL
eukprot:6004473-Pleurochrysis_carterae.AAC.1